MPKSRKRRKPKQSSRRARGPARTGPPKLASGHLGDRLPYLAQMAAVDEAERRGDARAALDLIEERLLDTDGNLFWRGDRIIRLTQLASLGPLLPRWATSRWLLEQALQELGPSGRPIVGQALQAVADVHGGLGHVRRPSGEDPRIKVLEHDWVFRQCLLYELGGLASYLRRVPLHLVTGADRVDEWARAPMGGYRFVERGSAVTVWEDVASGDRTETANIGSAAMLLLGECAIGRLVPIDGGRMFETVPLRVPEGVACAVAAEPAGWLSALRDAVRAGERIETGGTRFGFLTDVPRVASVLTVYDELDLLDRYPERAEKLLACVREAFDEEPTKDPDAVDVWACVAAELLHPSVLSALADGLRPSDAELYTRLAQTVAEPAATLARLLASEARDVA
ncbi:hypothetical protein [Nocardioides bizhenqiangii]|uniref:Uncharacterized protein n=1 Tax=Nocardioides bizhenqiangii TaxID=3095076 RepID=A0ABZ0ZSY5_9ACTN|nr:MULTISPECIES: hypothetical protein [unclassified Nocardioides]MDZ5622011.1 hypothetical protein [Nocardioides sp. HM23]WQQ27312.1 hypothetical protein SHK19_03575 [Nocardioides sp. HM61]